jgi:hypothetical protein
MPTKRRPLIKYELTKFNYSDILADAAAALEELAIVTNSSIVPLMR